MGDLPTNDRPAGASDRWLASSLLLVLAAALVAAPAMPYPAAFERHLAALVACGSLALAAICVLFGRPFPIPPLPAATLGIAGALAFTAALPLSSSAVYSPERAYAVAAGGAGLVWLSAIARGSARAGLSALLLWGSCALGGAVAIASLLESLGLDPLRAAPFYDSRGNPVATLGNPDPLANFLAPATAVAASLALSSRGGRRAVALVAAGAGALALGIAGVVYGFVALGLGLVIALRFAARRAADGGPPLRIAVALLLLGLAAGGNLARHQRSPAPTESAPSAAVASASWPIPSTLEVRVRVWVASLKLAFAFAPWGAGAGNFAIAFPRQRDPREIELSTHFRADSAESVVDHAHNEPIQLLVETGALGALALGALFLGLRRWGRQGVFTSSSDAAAASAGLGAIAVASLAHAPISDTAASAVLASLLLGIVGSHDSAGRAYVPALFARPLAAVLLAALPFGAVLAVNALQADALITAERLDPQAGGERLRRAMALAPADEHPALLLARWLRAQGDRAGALGAYGEALRRNPFQVEPLLNCGVMLAESGDFEAALAAFGECERLDPNHPALRHNRMQLAIHRADAARDAKKDRDAAELLDQAIALGASEELLHGFGVFFFEAGEFERAIPYLDRHAARNPDDAESWHKLGTSFQKVGNLEAASLDFSRAHHLFALEFFRAGQLDAAARSAKQYHHWSLPEDAGPFVLDALIELKRGDRDAAAASLEKAESTGARLDRRQAERQEYALLLAEPQLGPRVRKLVK